PFRVLLFTIVAEVEYLLATTLDRIHPDDSWIDLLQPTEDRPDPKAELLERKRNACSWDTTMPLTTFAEIGHLIEAVAASPQAIEMLGETGTIADELKSLPDLRNRIAHVVKPVVQGPSEIAKTAKQIDLLLGWIGRWSKRLSGP
ncbi:MAG: hypothetical protein PHQ53_13125, partial [Candidatus Krumholzibacteria bacterium]|nr:hypothetical protein [Candidatus Krumholzibacteria bacterium]